MNLIGADGKTIDTLQITRDATNRTNITFDNRDGRFTNSFINVAFVDAAGKVKATEQFIFLSAITYKARVSQQTKIDANVLKTLTANLTQADNTVMKANPCAPRGHIC